MNNTARSLRRLSAALLIVAVACGGGKDSTSPTNSGCTSGCTGGGGDGGSTSNAIAIADNSFTPSSTTVPVGTTVTWTWTGSGTHNVTFSSPSITGSATKTSGTFTKQFNTAGTFNYQCSIHGVAMSGSITVQ